MNASGTTLGEIELVVMIIRAWWTVGWARGLQPEQSTRKGTVFSTYVRMYVWVQKLYFKVAMRKRDLVL